MFCLNRNKQEKNTDTVNKNLPALRAGHVLMRSTIVEVAVALQRVAQQHTDPTAVG